MGLAASYAVAWQFCFVLAPRIVTDMSKQVASLDAIAAFAHSDAALASRKCHRLKFCWWIIIANSLFLAAPCYHFATQLGDTR